MALVGIVTIFFPILPVGIETQPVIIAILIIFLAPAVVRSIRFQRDPDILSVKWLLVVLTISALIGLYRYPGAMLSLLRYAIPLLFYIAVRNMDLRPAGGLIRWLILLHCLLAVLYLSGKADILRAIFNRYSSDLGQVRGFSYLSQEAGYAAGYLFAIFIACYISNFKHRRLYCWTTLVLIAITKSLVGLLYVVLGVFLILESTTQIMAAVGITVLVAATGAVALAGSTSRLGQILASLSNVDPAHLFLSIIILEPSGAIRVLMNGYSFAMGFSSIIGHGVGSFAPGFMPAAHQFGADLFYYNSSLGPAYQNNIPITPQAAFASLVFEIGFLSLLYVVPFYITIKRIPPLRKDWFVGIAVASIALFFQSEISNPGPFYVVLLLAGHSRANRKQVPAGPVSIEEEQ